MLSEGWDAKTVTHIMGLRAFTSQLLCEQVVGRGLRRTSYELTADNLFEPEYVNVFGVPFTFLPHESDETTKPTPTKARTRVEVLPDRRDFEIVWSHVLRVDQTYETRLTLDLERVAPLRLDAADIVLLAQLAPTVDGKPDLSRIKEVELEDLARRSRLQTIVFKTAGDVYDQLQPGWPGRREALLGQVVPLAERFLRSDRLEVRPAYFGENALCRRIVLTLGMGRIVQHLFEAIRHENVSARRIVLDPEQPRRSTGDMATWFTTKPCAPTQRSHINVCVFDSTWESTEAFALDQAPEVAAWAKNDHLGFEVHYLFQGAVRKYRPDFLVRLRNGLHLVVEVKGQASNQDKAKRAALSEWVEAVNEHGGFGRWACDVSFGPTELREIVARHASAARAEASG
jgi:type III restriction enzyme